MTYETPTDRNAHPSQDVLIDLAAGLTPEPEAGTLIAHLRSCEACDARFATVVGDLERARARVGAWREGTRRWRRHHTIAASGVALAAAFAIVFFARPLSHTPPGPWLPPAGGPIEQHLRGGGTEADALWKGIGAYDARDLNRAIQSLAAAHPADQGLDRMRRVYLASAYLLKDRPRDALATLGDIDAASLPHPWRGEALWIEAESLDRLGRADEARRTLERLAAEPGDAGDRARRRLGSGAQH